MQQRETEITRNLVLTGHIGQRGRAICTGVCSEVWVWIGPTMAASAFFRR
jgi:hypothetical protein